MAEQMIQELYEIQMKASYLSQQIKNTLSNNPRPPCGMEHKQGQSCVPVSNQTVVTNYLASNQAKNSCGCANKSVQPSFAKSTLQPQSTNLFSQNQMNSYDQQYGQQQNACLAQSKFSQQRQCPQINQTPQPCSCSLQTSSCPPPCSSRSPSQFQQEPTAFRQLDTVTSIPFSQQPQDNLQSSEDSQDCRERFHSVIFELLESFETVIIFVKKVFIAMEYISGYFVVQTQKDCCLSIYKLPPCVYIAGQSYIKIWTCPYANNPNKLPSDLVFKELTRWKVGDDVLTTLYRCDGKPVSCLRGSSL
ncbi:hypothetical protein HELRODRAFT_174254 [Helobdella robusta]|uniref:Uncharacterized protein n=1 Tax=Helobdella robusta TaxID=6412 RepID=T1F7W3_HELRO|nr:hypothetical protein HELRODRAFT_174254 [Helobdella robusta]ESO02830.1 hypothetical protein HELRODRAFT_174254 [Helobdella robusta]